MSNTPLPSQAETGRSESSELHPMREERSESPDGLLRAAYIGAAQSPPLSPSSSEDVAAANDPSLLPTSSETQTARDKDDESSSDASPFGWFQEQLRVLQEVHDDEMDNRREELEQAFDRIDFLEDQWERARDEAGRAILEIDVLRGANTELRAALSEANERVVLLSALVNELRENLQPPSRDQ
ncbi:uncharacterized protein B0H18DRAFT_957601 [Fomitopsis serialis]|uniref:uncharacterized protein n=1 Tax=Fomitopsis serialis TaxID=139415 RepID=UPI002008CEC6|nr:uncharacterized protein B0H18DRAFT_1126582 [Neoantrodia serialis]XP_047889503.1 uncharacterized protein B0H18DRAFT_957601 [Neoantrodia serialis]KAH9913116.1 hypothetical protein B0H18DRAFT_1126582 [Neoantrodia serialis]KAH9919345.1 hypothetical protein B0H18DRAFT_957601 [Neoantrodia serialis]